MGCSSSYQSSYQDADIWESAKQRALDRYNYRIKHYNYLIHGPIDYYMTLVEAEYELDCIPEQFRYGNFI